ncbi:hypothetical protein AWH69_07370 [Janibacter melonis]|uniref:Uncharacterized protein n=1 Tax=Janibacter melonis TaxID=262209 RepID=A0A176QDT7_9MICO|nr:hypothetical protein [Janibacter melonis]OAB87844.1 hypothetical protein AWH69_07370 [Janibacter melonis]
MGIGTIVIIGAGVFFTLMYAAAAVVRGMTGMWAGVPVVVVGVALVWQARRRWTGARGERGGGGGLMLLGCLFIFGSLWAAVMTNDAIS